MATNLVRAFVGSLIAVACFSLGRPDCARADDGTAASANPLLTSPISPFSDFEWTDTPESFLLKLARFPELTNVSLTIKRRSSHSKTRDIDDWKNPEAIRHELETLHGGAVNPDLVFGKQLIDEDVILSVSAEPIALQGTKLQMTAVFKSVPGLALVEPELVMEFDTYMFAGYLSHLTLSGVASEEVATQLAENIKSKYGSLPGSQTDAALDEQTQELTIRNGVGVVTAKWVPNHLYLIYGVGPLDAWTDPLNDAYEDARKQKLIDRNKAPSQPDRSGEL